MIFLILVVPLLLLGLFKARGAKAGTTDIADEQGMPGADASAALHPESSTPEAPQAVPSASTPDPTTASAAPASSFLPGREGHSGVPHRTKAPSLRSGAVQVNGRLPPEVISRIVRQNYGGFRVCYEQALRSDPSLTGRVSVKFVIDGSGAVSTASDGGSSVPDKNLIACVIRGFNSLSFPQPEGGIVSVVYPIIFSPGD